MIGVYTTSQIISSAASLHLTQTNYCSGFWDRTWAWFLVFLGSTLPHLYSSFSSEEVITHALAGASSYSARWRRYHTGSSKIVEGVIVLHEAASVGSICESRCCVIKSETSLTWMSCFSVCLQRDLMHKCSSLQLQHYSVSWSLGKQFVGDYWSLIIYFAIRSRHQKALY